MTPMQVVREFRAHGLEAVKPRRMEPRDYGLAPYVGHGVHFLIPSLCDDCGGRVFTGKISHLRSLKRYYDSFGKSSAILFSWTHLNRERRVLLQINGELPRKKWRRYRAVVQNL